MSQELTTFDYAGLPVEDVTEVRAAAERIRVRMKRTAEDIIEIGRDLTAVKGRMGRPIFLLWLKNELGISESSATKMMDVGRMYGDGVRNYYELTPTVLYALSAPSTPAEIVTQVEARAVAGEDISVAEIKRLKDELAAKSKEAASAKAEAERKGSAAERIAKEKEELAEKFKQSRIKASLREENLIEDKKRLFESAKQAQAMSDEAASRAARDAWEEADEKYETKINELVRLRKEAENRAAKAEQDAKAEAEKMAAAITAAKMAETAKELKEIEANRDRAQRACAAANATRESHLQELDAIKTALEKNKAEKAKWASGEAETADQIKIANIVARACGDAMIELNMLEHGAQPAAIEKLQRASSICRQMADAIDSFIAQRLA